MFFKDFFPVFLIKTELLLLFEYIFFSANFHYLFRVTQKMLFFFTILLYIF